MAQNIFTALFRQPRERRRATADHSWGGAAKAASDSQCHRQVAGHQVSGDVDAEMMGNTLQARARARERKRCAAIFADAAADANLGLAATLAFQTTLPRDQAIKVLRAGGVAPGSKKPDLSERKAGVNAPNVTPAAHAVGPKEAVTGFWDSIREAAASRGRAGPVSTKAT
jgi:hypothetical protein